MTTARHITFALMVSLSALSLAACSGEVAKDQAAASGAPDAKPGVVASDARLVLPAVAGNPGAAYFSFENQGKDRISLAAVAVEGSARTEIHTVKDNAMIKVDRVDADPGTKIAFKPGELHVMVFDLSPDIKVGDETEITLTFADGDKVTLKAKVQSTGEAAMGGMKHGGEH